MSWQHIEHAVQVCGEDHVGIGSDLSLTPHEVNEGTGATTAPCGAQDQCGDRGAREDPNVFFFTSDLNSPRRLELIADALLARRHSEARVEKIVGGNFVRLMRDVWGE